MAKAASGHPYLVSAGLLSTAVAKFRNSLPETINLATLKKLQIASGNEKQVLDILRFLGLLDDAGKPVDKCVTLFNTHKDEDFQKKLAELVRSAYGDLFSLHKENAWGLPDAELIGYFRAEDKSTASRGTRQAIAFTSLGVMAGKREASANSSIKKGSGKGTTRAKKSEGANAGSKGTGGKREQARVTAPEGDSTRPAIAINIQLTLPSGIDEAGYEKLFAAMKKHLWPDA